MARKMTAQIIEVVYNENSLKTEWKEYEPITCEVVGEMDTGTKIWQDIETGKQYFAWRIFGKYYFSKDA